MTHTLQFCLSENAIMPQKSYESDAGWDLTLIKKIKDIKIEVTANQLLGFDEDAKFTYAELYTTGVRVKPPPGYHTELVGRSSISKTGYMLANNIGIIDESYRGEIMVCLIKPNQPNNNFIIPNLKLPCRLVQLILRKTESLPAKCVSTDEFEMNTNRGEGGFGSTN